MPGVIIPTPEGGPVGVHGWDGSEWQKVGVDQTDRLRVSLYGKSTAAGDAPLLVQDSAFPNLRVGVFRDGVNVTQSKNADGVHPDLNLGLSSYPHVKLFNGTAWDRGRGNVELTLLASAARTATTSSSDQTNYNARGVVVFFDITVVPGADTVTLSVEAKDPVSGKYFTLLDGGAQAAAGQFLYAVYPGAADSEAKFDAFEEMPLPRTWRVTVTHSGTGSFTYSVGACMIW